MKVVVGGIIEKDGKVLLVQEAKEKCYGKWNVSAGHLELNETLTDGAIREIKEETGCDVELTGILGITNWVGEDGYWIAIIFSTKLIDENIKVDKNEILDVKWFDIDYVINNMNNELRESRIMKHVLTNLKNNNIASLDILNDIKN